VIPVVAGVYYVKPVMHYAGWPPENHEVAQIVHLMNPMDPSWRAEVKLNSYGDVTRADAWWTS